MKKNVQLLFAFLILISCRFSKTHTYYCEKANISFSVEERENEDVLIIEKYDSLFFPSSRGNYLGVGFYIPDNSNYIYIGSSFNVKRYSEKNYVIKFMDRDYEGLDVYYPLLGKNFWGFQGGCDQNSYLFAAYHDSIYILPMLKPLEW